MMKNSTVVMQEDLGNYNIVKKNVTWKNKTYRFDDYCYDGGEYVMYKLDINEKLVEIGRIECQSGIFVMIKEQDDIEILEVIL